MDRKEPPGAAYNMSSATLYFILVEPQLPENIGAVARVMANFSLFDLRVVSPLCDVTHKKAIATAAGAENILKQASVFTSTREAVADCQWVYGTCATHRSMTKIYTPIRPAMTSLIAHPGRTAILFGPERTGLTNEDQVRCRHILQIPVNPQFSSLNLSQAASLVAYECFMALSAAPEKPQLHTGESIPAPQAYRQAFLNSLESHLNCVEFWRIPHKKPIMWQNIQNIFTRLDLTEQEVRTLWGMIRRLFSYPRS